MAQEITIFFFLLMQVGFLFHEFVQSLLDVNFQHPQHPLGKSYSLCVLWKKKKTYFFWTCQLLTLIFHHFCIRIDRKQLILLIFSTSFFLYNCRSPPFCFLHRQVCLRKILQIDCIDCLAETRKSCCWMNLIELCWNSTKTCFTGISLLPTKVCSTTNTWYNSRITDKIRKK